MTIPNQKLDISKRMMTYNLQRADGGAWRVSEFDPGRLEGELQRLLCGQTARPYRDVNDLIGRYEQNENSHWPIVNDGRRRAGVVNHPDWTTMR